MPRQQIRREMGGNLRHKCQQKLMNRNILTVKWKRAKAFRKWRKDLVGVAWPDHQRTCPLV